MKYEHALQRMPHRDAMQLIDTVLRADIDAIQCRAKPHSASDYPLRADGRLFNTALVELGAQAAAAHASLFGIGAAHVGLLLTLSGVETAIADVDETSHPLQVHAVRLHGDEGSARYRFRVFAEESETTFVSGDAVLSMRASA